jgi:hypothetical protein
MGWGDVRYCFTMAILVIIIIIVLFLSFFPWTMNLSTADLRNYWTEFHETWQSNRYMFLVGPKVFSFVVKGVSHILRGSKGVGVTIESYGKLEISYINVDNF